MSNWEHRKTAAAEAIAGGNADIVGVQEAFDFQLSDLRTSRSWIDQEPVGGRWPSDHYPVLAEIEPIR